MFITVSKTRWHGYVESMVRYLELQDRLKAWLYMETDDRLNIEPLKELLLDSYETMEI